MSGRDAQFFFDNYSTIIGKSLIQAKTSRAKGQVPYGFVVNEYGQ